MLSRLCGAGPPWDAIDWPPHVHLALFVHRVDGLVPGVYAYLRDDSVLDVWRSAMRPEFLWERMSDDRLFLLLPHDVTWVAARVSCDQDIAGAGFFSLGMIATSPDGTASHTAPLPPTVNVEIVAVTIEPAGGSPSGQPTSQPILAGKIAS